MLTKGTKRAGAIGKVIVSRVPKAPCVESWCSGGVKRTVTLVVEVDDSAGDGVQKEEFV